MYRKFKANHLFTGYEILPGNNVLITDETGTIIDIVDEKNVGDNIEIFNGILTPGFINCHCHLELSHMKGIVPPKTGLVDFVQQVLSKRNESAEIKFAAMQNAEQELNSSGTVAVGDICNTTDSISVKQKSKIHFHNFIEVSGFVNAAAEKRFNDAKTVLNNFQNSELRTQNYLIGT